mgnify:CR=1 FL=1
MHARWMSAALVASVLAWSVGCASNGMMAPEADKEVMEEPMAMPQAASAPMDMDGAGTGGAVEGAKARRAPMRDKKSEDLTVQLEALGYAADAPDAAMDGDDQKPAGNAEVADAEGEEARTRSWFPESLLWQPLVETDNDGVATVPVTVPDQLTTWRVLALAHDRRGQQAGAEHSFVGTLPVYVEPVVPGWLYAGDRVVVPVQAMNTTGDRLSAELTVRATGAASGAAGGALSLSPGGSAVRDLPMDVSGAGTALVSARLQAPGGGDAAERSIVVHPEGKPVLTTRGGALAGERSLSLQAPKGADPRTERVEVVVFPGPLAVVQAELERLSGGGSDGAYAFAVAGHAETLASAVGVELDEAVLRRLRILAWQRVVRATRAPSAGDAADLLMGMQGVSGHELAEQRVRTLERRLQQGQRADGSWSRVSRSTLQRVIVETSLAARVLPADATGPRLRAKGALERMLPDVKDPYTAAVVLSTGLVEGEDADALRELVEDAIVERDGQLTLPVPARVVNAWGVRPTSSEMLAVGALALEGEARGDLVAALMQRWSAVYGFGAGRADPLALEAIVTALPTHDGEVTVSLALDGQAAASATLDPSQPGVPAALTASAKGAKTLTLTASPEVPGLTFVATRRSWVPWGNQQGLAGIDVEVDLGTPRVGQEGTVTLSVSAPKGTAVTLEQGLPAGASVDTVALGQLDTVRSHEVRQDRVILTTRPLGAGEVLKVPLRVTPAFAGRFATVPLKVGAEGQEALVEPVRWTVR